jgi:hypothetical protein
MNVKELVIKSATSCETYGAKKRDVCITMKLKQFERLENFKVSKT